MNFQFQPFTTFEWVAIVAMCGLWWFIQRSGWLK